MSIPVINFDFKPAPKRVVEMFPNVVRAGIFGPSGAGKTNLLLTILVHIKPFYHIYLCSKTAFQEKYHILEELIDGYNEKNTKKVEFHKFVSSIDLPDVESVPEGSIFIFDDVLCDKQDRIAQFFLHGRHRSISCFYLSQAFTKIEKKTGIRSNFNYLILLAQDLVNLRQIYTEYVTDMSFQAFRELCNKCWAEKYGFLVIDTENRKNRYKKNFVYK